MKLKSKAFKQGGSIPKKYTCDGENINPPLEISGVSGTANSLALIVEDPDAPSGTFVHWVLWNIHPATENIAEGEVPSECEQGINDFGKKEYGGPCPPSGEHRYFFKLYALDTTLNLPSGAKKDQLESSILGQVESEAELMGVYKRS